MGCTPVHPPNWMTTRAGRLFPRGTEKNQKGIMALSATVRGFPFSIDERSYQRRLPECSALGHKRTAAKQLGRLLRAKCGPGLFDYFVSSREKRCGAEMMSALDTNRHVRCS